MLKQKSKRSVLFFRLSLLAILLTVCAVSVGTVFLRTEQVRAATNSTLNFQARLLTASGSIVPDGNYNLEFKVYNATSSSGSSQGSCSGDTNCLWVETRTTTNKVRMVNGYLTVNLGSVASFSGSINWDQELWLTMNIGGTGSPGWDGEMSPRLKLTAVPYAFRAGQLATLNGANTATLGFVAPTANRAINLPDESGTVCLQASSACGFLTTSAANTGYIQNQNSSPQTANFIINGTGRADTALQAPLLDTATAVALNIGTSSATVINLNQNTTLASGKTLTAQGTVLFQNSADSATAFRVQNTNSHAIFTVDTSGSQVILGKASNITGKILFQNGTNANTVAIQSGTTGTSYTLTLPTALGSSGNCLVDTNGSGVLGFSSCGGTSTTLQNAYDAGNTITTTSARNVSIVLADTATDSNFAVNMQCSTCSTDGGRFEIQNAGTAAFWLNPGSAAGQRGTAIFRNTTNDVNAFRVQTSGGGSTVFNVDTSNSRVGINNAGPAFALDVTGDANISSGSAYKINSINICTSSGCTASSASAILNQTTVQAANMYVQAASTGTVAAKLQAFNGGSGNIAEFLNGTGTTVGSISSTGAMLVKPSTNNTSAFQVQPSGSTTPVFNVDTSNSRVGIGTATPSTTFNIAINNTQVTTPMAILEQAGTGDATIQFKNSTNSFYAGIDTSDNTSFSINSSSAAGAASTATPAHVQSLATSLITTGAVANQSVTFSSNNTAGNLIVAAATWDVSGGATSATCSDTRGNSYSSVIITTDVGNNQTLAVCYALNIAAGSNQVTMTYVGGSANFRQMSIHEYSGVVSVSALDTSSSNTSVGLPITDGYTSNSSTTTADGDLIYGVMFKTSGAPQALTPGTNFTQRVNNSDFISEDRVQTTAGSVAATFTGGSFSYVAHMLAFKAATTGGTVTDAATTPATVVASPVVVVSTVPVVPAVL